MKRLPYWSKDRLGSQQASPSLSLLPISFVDQVLPPSKLTPSNMPAVSPASLCPTLVTTTMFLGFVGLIAIASSDSLRCRWLTSTFAGVPWTVAVAVANGTAAKAAAISKRPPDSLRMASSFYMWPVSFESIARRVPTANSILRSCASPKLPGFRHLGQSDAGPDGSQRPGTWLAILPGLTPNDIGAAPALAAAVEPCPR